jgi:hypothetical protein
MKRDTAELLAAYVDGVGELTPSERRRVELYLADQQGARDDESATRDLIGKLRELPPQSEPDWTALERQIQEALPDETPRVWWRRFALPAVLALAGATAILVLALRGTTPEPTPDPIVHVPAPTVEDAPVVVEQPIDDRVAVYLDGTDLELALESAELADDKLDELTLSALSAGIESTSEASRKESSRQWFDTRESLLGEDLGWVDELGDAELQKLERLLDRKQG